MKRMYLNFDKSTLRLVFPWFLTVKINLYHQHFPDTLEKYTLFPVLLFFSVVM